MITTASLTAEFAAEVRRDLQLTPKQLQSKYLYDALGSSVFEAICRLPWYRITRAENRLLHSHADEIVIAIDREPSTIVELGSVDKEYFIAMEHVRGRDLAETMRTLWARVGPPRPELVACIHDPQKLGHNGRRLASILDEVKLRRVLARMLAGVGELAATVRFRPISGHGVCLDSAGGPRDRAFGGCIFCAESDVL